MAHGMNLRREGETLDKDNVGEIFDFEVRTFDDAEAPAEAPRASARADAGA